MTNQASDDEFGEYVYDSNSASLHVPLDPRITDPVKFTEVNNGGESGLGTIRTKLEDINKPNQLRVTGEAEPEDMKNNLIFERNLKYFRYFGAMLGAEIEFGWKPGFRFLISLFIASFFVSQLTYTQYLHIKNQNYYRILETLACYGITVSMMLKIWTLLKCFKAIKALFNTTIKLCKSNDNGCRAVKIRDRFLYNSRFYKWTAILVMASLSIFIAYPTKAFFVDHEWIPLLPIELMFVDMSTFTGFITVNLIESVMGVFASAATAYTILIIVAMILNYSVFVDMFEDNMKILDEMWNGDKNPTVAYRHSFLRNMCMERQDMDAYILEVKKILDDYIFYYFIASYLGQIICLFQIVVSDWKSGYAIAYGMFLEMMFYCLMGTKITTENERITSALQQSNWYSYDTYSQKLFLLLWVSSTNAKEMWVGPVAPLSVLTGTNVVKSIYTYFNILLEVV